MVVCMCTSLLYGSLNLQGVKKSMFFPLVLPPQASKSLVIYTQKIFSPHFQPILRYVLYCVFRGYGVVLGKARYFDSAAKLEKKKKKLSQKGSNVEFFFITAFINVQLRFLTYSFARF